MATETVSNLSDLLKEVWTEDRLVRQFYTGTKWYDKVERTNEYTIGRQAQVPLETSLPGGTTTTLAAGSSALNAADDLSVDRADYTLSYIWQQVAVETAALAQGAGGVSKTTVDAADQTIKSNVLAARKEANRQAASNGDALIALTLGTASQAEVLLALPANGYGYDAIVRGWLRPGMTVDIGTTSSEASVTADKLITSVTESAAAPSITLESSVTLSGTTYVSIANNRTGATSKEANGLRNIVGSASSTIGTIAGGGFWAPASVDTTTTLVSLDLMVSLRNSVYQKTGAEPKYVTTSVKQSGELYKLFQSQARFDGDNPSAGNVSSFTWNGMNVNADPDIPDRELYLLNLEDFFVLTGAGLDGPKWVSDIEGGSGGRLRWAQGSTKFVDALVTPFQLGVKRRNASASAIGLTG